MKHALEDAPVIQTFGSLVPVRLGLEQAVRHRSVAALNRLLAHSMALSELYQKAHWQVSGPTFSQLHLLFDRHHEQQLKLVDLVAERVQTLGGVAFALAHDVAAESRISRAPSGRESANHFLERLAEGHELLLHEARPLARQVALDGDDGSNDLIVGSVVRTNEVQCWMICEHLVAQGQDSINHD